MIGLLHHTPKNLYQRELEGQVFPLTRAVINLLRTSVFWQFGCSVRVFFVDFDISLTQIFDGRSLSKICPYLRVLCFARDVFSEKRTKNFLQIIKLKD